LPDCTTNGASQAKHNGFAIAGLSRQAPKETLGQNAVTVRPPGVGGDAAIVDECMSVTAHLQIRNGD